MIGLLKKIQKQYDAYYDLFKLIPSSDDAKIQKKAENTFIHLIYSVVERTLLKNNPSAHVIETITALIAYDFKILLLDTKLLPTDNSADDIANLRKKVSRAVKNTNKLQLNP